MLGLDVPSSSEDSEMMELTEMSVQQRQLNLISGDSIERPSHLIDLQEPEEESKPLPKMSQTQPLS
jgi:hypothetical protein